MAATPTRARQSLGDAAMLDDDSDAALDAPVAMKSRAFQGAAGASGSASAQATAGKDTLGASATDGAAAGCQRDDPGTPELGMATPEPVAHARASTPLTGLSSPSPAASSEAGSAAAVRALGGAGEGGLGSPPPCALGSARADIASKRDELAKELLGDEHVAGASAGSKLVGLMREEVQLVALRKQLEGFTARVQGASAAALAADIDATEANLAKCVGQQEQLVESRGGYASGAAGIVAELKALLEQERELALEEAAGKSGAARPHASPATPPKAQQQQLPSAAPSAEEGETAARIQIDMLMDMLQMERDEADDLRSQLEAAVAAAAAAESSQILPPPREEDEDGEESFHVEVLQGVMAEQAAEIEMLQKELEEQARERAAAAELLQKEVEEQAQAEALKGTIADQAAEIERLQRELEEQARERAAAAELLAGGQEEAAPVPASLSEEEVAGEGAPGGLWEASGSDAEVREMLGSDVALDEILSQVGSELSSIIAEGAADDGGSDGAPEDAGAPPESAAAGDNAPEGSGEAGEPAPRVSLKEARGKLAVSADFAGEPLPGKAARAQATALARALVEDGRETMAAANALISGFCGRLRSELASLQRAAAEAEGGRGEGRGEAPCGAANVAAAPARMAYIESAVEELGGKFERELLQSVLGSQDQRARASASLHGPAPDGAGPSIEHVLLQSVFGKAGQEAAPQPPGGGRERLEREAREMQQHLELEGRKLAAQEEAGRRLGALLQARREEKDALEGDVIPRLLSEVAALEARLGELAHRGDSELAATAAAAEAQMARELAERAQGDAREARESASALEAANARLVEQLEDSAAKLYAASAKSAGLQGELDAVSSRAVESEAAGRAAEAASQDNERLRAELRFASDASERGEKALGDALARCDEHRQTIHGLRAELEGARFELATQQRLVEALREEKGSQGELLITARGQAEGARRLAEAHKERAAAEAAEHMRVQQELDSVRVWLKGSQAECRRQREVKERLKARLQRVAAGGEGVSPDDTLLADDDDSLSNISSEEVGGADLPAEEGGVEGEEAQRGVLEGLLRQAERQRRVVEKLQGYKVTLQAETNDLEASIAALRSEHAGMVSAPASASGAEVAAPAEEPGAGDAGPAMLEGGEADAGELEGACAQLRGHLAELQGLVAGEESRLLVLREEEMRVSMQLAESRLKHEELGAQVLRLTQEAAAPRVDAEGSTGVAAALAAVDGLRAEEAGLAAAIAARSEEIAVLDRQWEALRARVASAAVESDSSFTEAGEAQAADPVESLGATPRALAGRRRRRRGGSAQKQHGVQQPAQRAELDLNKLDPEFQRAESARHLQELEQAVDSQLAAMQSTEAQRAESERHLQELKLAVESQQHTLQEVQLAVESRRAETAALEARLEALRTDTTAAAATATTAAAAAAAAAAVEPAIPEAAAGVPAGPDPLDDALARNAQLEETLAGLRALVSTYEDEHASLAGASGNLRKEFDGMKREAVPNLRAQVRELEREFARSTAGVAEELEALRVAKSEAARDILGMVDEARGGVMQAWGDIAAAPRPVAAVAPAKDADSVDRLQHVCAVLQEQAAQLQDEVQARKAELDTSTSELEATRGELGGQVGVLREEKAALEGAVRDLSQMVQGEACKLAAQQQAQQDLQRQLDAQGKAQALLEAQALPALAEEVRAVQAVFSRAKAGAKADLEQLRGEKLDAEAEISSLATGSRRLLAHVKEAARDDTSIPPAPRARGAGASSSELRRVRRDAEELAEELEEARGKARQQHKRAGRLEEQLEARSEEVSSLARKADAASRARAQLQAAVEDHEASLATWRKRADAAQRELAEERAAGEDLQRRLESALKAKRQLEAEGGAHEQALRRQPHLWREDGAAAAQLDADRRAAAALRGECAELESKLDADRRAAAALRGERAELESQLRDLRVEVSELDGRRRAQESAARQRAAAEAAAIASAKAQVDALERSWVALRGEADAELAALGEDVEVAGGDVAQIQAEISAYALQLAAAAGASQEEGAREELRVILGDVEAARGNAEAARAEVARHEAMRELLRTDLDALRKETATAQAQAAEARREAGGATAAKMELMEAQRSRLKQEQEALGIAREAQEASSALGAARLDADRLAREKDELALAITSLEKQRAEAAAACEDAGAVRAARAAECERLAAECESRKGELARGSVASTAAAAELAKLQEQCKEAAGERDILREQIKGLRGALAEGEEASMLREQHACLVGERAALRSHVSSLQKEVRELGAIAAIPPPPAPPPEEAAGPEREAALRAQLDAAELLCDEQMKEAGRLQAELGRVQQQLAEAEAARAEGGGAPLDASVGSDGEGAGGSYWALQLERDSLRDELARATQQRAASQAAAAESGRECSKAREELAAAAADVAALRARAEALEAAMAAREKEGGGYASQLKDVKMSLTEKRLAMEELVRDLEAAKAALVTLQKEARAQADANTELKAEGVLSKEAVGGLRSDIAALEAQRAQLQAEVASLQRGAGAARDADALQGRNAQLEAEVLQGAELACDVAALEGRNAQLEAEVLELRMGAELAGDVATLEAQRSQLEVEVSEMRREAMAAREGAQLLQMQVFRGSGSRGGSAESTPGGPSLNSSVDMSAIDTTVGSIARGTAEGSTTAAAFGSPQGQPSVSSKLRPAAPPRGGEEVSRSLFAERGGGGISSDDMPLHAHARGGDGAAPAPAGGTGAFAAGLQGENRALRAALHQQASVLAEVVSRLKSEASDLSRLQPRAGGALVVTAVVEQLQRVESLIGTLQGRGLDAARGALASALTPRGDRAGAGAGGHPLGSQSMVDILAEISQLVDGALKLRESLPSHGGALQAPRAGGARAPFGGGISALARVGTGWDVGEAAAARELRRLQLLNKVKDARLGELEKLVFIDG